MWGNTPAFDVLQLKSHEGLVDQKDLALLFAGLCRSLLSI